jgi:hypothetical protein
MPIKQDKTFGSITVHDVLYRPTVERITEYNIKSIQKKSQSELYLKYSNGDMIVSRSQTTTRDHLDTVCVNKAKAIEIQDQLRREKLKSLIRSVDKKQAELNEFINKYF